MKKVLASACLCLLLPFAALAAQPPALDTAQLNDLLEKNRGKVIMINFFATWCPPCRVEIPELTKLRNAYGPEDFLLLGLSVDENASAVEPFVTAAGVNYPIYLADRSITDALNISSVPHNTFYARDGSMVISEPGMAELSVLKEVVDNLLNKK